MIFGLLAIGFAVLLVAPRIHRKVNARSRSRAETRRSRRVAALRASPGGVEVPVDTHEVAVRARDMLLLRGVRVEVASDAPGARIVTTAADRAAVEAVLSEIGET